VTRRAGLLVPDLDAGGAVGAGHSGLLEEQESSDARSRSSEQTPSEAPWDVPWDETTPDSAVLTGPERTQRTPTSTRPNRAKSPASQPQRRSQVGGGGGIRTRGPRERTPVFKTGAFDRSATPPG